MAIALDWLATMLPKLSEMAAPADAYQRLLDTAPVFSPDRSTLIVARYRHVNDILRHPASSSRYGWATTVPRAAAAFITLDPPDHTRIRSLVSKAFTPGRVAKFRSQFEAVVHKTIDSFAPDEVEIVSAFASPLPVIAITELLGIPSEDRERFLRWLTIMAVGVDNVVRLQPMTHADQQLRRRTYTEFRRFITALAERRRQEPTDDMFSDLALASEVGTRLSNRELVSNIELLLLAGQDTTTSALATGSYYLARCPELQDPLASSSEYAERFVDETIRLHSPLQMVLRYATEAIDFDDLSIPAGTFIVVCVGAANVDPERFVNPGTFDPERVDTRRSVAFGSGIHRCVGAALARMEGGVALRALAARLVNPQIRSNGVRYRDSLLLHQFSAIPMKIDGLRAAV